MLLTKTFRDVPWVDMYNPTQDEIKTVMETYGLDSGVAEELLIPSLKPRVERYASYFYLILHFPAFKQSHTKGNSQEVDIVIGKDFLITVRYDTNESVERFSKFLDVEKITKKVDIEAPALFMFFTLMDYLYSGSQFEIEHTGDRLQAIEEQIYSGKEKEMVFAISRLSRDVLSFKQIISPHKEVLKGLSSEWKLIFNDEHKHKLERMIAYYFRIKNELFSVIDTMHELRQTNDSLLTTKQNETMKIFTILAFVTFPLSLFAGIFGMNTTYTPFVGSDYDFWLIIGLMFGLTLVMFIIFKIKKWL